MSGSSRQSEPAIKSAWGGPGRGSVIPSQIIERSGSLPAAGWPPKRRESEQDSLLFGAGGPIRTGTALRPGDFKSPVSTIPPHRRAQILYHSPRCVSRKKGAALPLPSKCRQSPKSVIASQCRNTGVAIRSIKTHRNTMASRDTDCHTSDIGHWFAMTGTYFVCSLKGAALPLPFAPVRRFSAQPMTTTPSGLTVTVSPVLTASRNSSPSMSTTGIFVSVHTSARIAPAASISPGAA